MKARNGETITPEYAEGYAAGYDDGWDHAEQQAKRAKPRNPLRALRKALRHRWHVWWLGSPSESVIGTNDPASRGHGLELRSIIRENGGTQPVRVEVDKSLDRGELKLSHVYRDGMLTRLTSRIHTKIFTMTRPLTEEPDDAESPSNVRH